MSILTLSTFSACELAQPFNGPGIEGGTFVTNVDEVVVVGTFIDLNDNDDAMRIFDERTQAIEGYFENDPEGYLGQSLRRSFTDNKFWTLALWESDEAMMNFVASDVHTQAMAVGADIAEDGKTVRFTQPREAGLPSWENVLTRLDEVPSFY